MSKLVCIGGICVVFVDESIFSEELQLSEDELFGGLIELIVCGDVVHEFEVITRQESFVGDESVSSSGNCN